MTELISQSQHDQLIAAGWAYDAGRDAYQPPKSAAWIDPLTAWKRLQAQAAPAAPKARDPRRSEPQ